ncbi:hypothetical protein [Pseudoclavibacter soli]|uniref:hypothetical protein n=1 Tax=Pseudoclavibacter soli TaxID=452623 RepID=UPI0004177FA2|nr:hypothetical protein [Pseudoclavibacter soli]
MITLIWNLVSAPRWARLLLVLVALGALAAIAYVWLLNPIVYPWMTERFVETGSEVVGS